MNDRVEELHRRLVAASDQDRASWKREHQRRLSGGAGLTTYTWVAPHGVVKVSRAEGSTTTGTTIYDANGTRIFSAEDRVCADLFRAAAARYDRQVVIVIEGILADLGEAP